MPKDLKVKDLLEILKNADPEAVVLVDHPGINMDYSYNYEANHVEVCNGYVTVERVEA